MSYSVNMLNMPQYPVSYGNTQADASQIAAYALAAQNEASEETKLTDGLAAMSVFSAGTGAYKLSKYAKNNGTTVGNLVKDSFQAAGKDVNTLKNIAKTQDKALYAKYVNGNKVSQEIFNLKSTLPNAKKLAKMTTENKAVYEKAGEILTKASNAKTVATQEKYLQQAKGVLETVSGKTAKATAKTVETTAKTVETVAKTTATAGKAATVGSKLLKCIKGNALFLAIEGGIELVTNVIPTFKQLGAKSGMKQLGKSTVKVGASVGGFAAGAAAGAAIGSIIPGAGTAVGAVVGGAISLVCGLFASNVASKAAKAVVGKDELEKEAAKQAVKAEAKKTEETNVTYISNDELMKQINPQQSTVQPQQVSNQFNPFVQNVNYTTQNNSDNLLMMPLNNSFRMTA